MALSCSNIKLDENGRLDTLKLKNFQIETRNTYLWKCTFMTPMTIIMRGGV